MRKIIAAGCLVMAMSLCVGCSSKKDSSEETTTATTEAKMKVQSKYKVPKITAAKKTDQLADAQKGETIVTMKVKGYGEMKFKFFNSLNSIIKIKNLSFSIQFVYNCVSYCRIIFFSYKGFNRKSILWRSINYRHVFYAR